MNLTNKSQKSKNINIKSILPVVLILVERALQLAFALLALRLLAQHLSVEDLGVLAYAQNLNAIFLSIAFFAGFELLTSKFSRHPKASAFIFSHAIYLRIFFVLICASLSQIFIHFYLQDEKIKLVFQILLLGPLLAEPIYVLAAWFVAQKYSMYLSIARILGVVLRLLLLFLLTMPTFLEIFAKYFNYFDIDLNFSFNIQTVAWIYSFEALVIAVVLVIAYLYHTRVHHDHTLLKLKPMKKAKPLIMWRFKPRIFILLMKHGAFLGLSLMLNYIFIRLDRILLAQTLSAYDLGIYQMAIQLNDAWLNVGVILVGMLAPIYFQRPTPAIYQNPPQEKRFVQDIIKKPLILILTFASLGAMLTYLFAPTLIHTLLGQKYDKSIPFLQHASFLAIPAFAAQILNTFILYHASARKYYALIIGYAIAVLTIVMLFYGFSYFLIHVLDVKIMANIQMHAMILMVGLAYMMMCFCGVFAIRILK